MPAAIPGSVHVDAVVDVSWRPSAAPNDLCICYFLCAQGRGCLSPECMYLTPPSPDIGVCRLFPVADLCRLQASFLTGCSHHQPVGDVALLSASLSRSNLCLLDHLQLAADIPSDIG